MTFIFLELTDKYNSAANAIFYDYDCSLALKNKLQLNASLDIKWFDSNFTRLDQVECHLINFRYNLNR